MNALRHQGDRAVVFASLTAVQVFFGLHYLAAKLVIQEVPPRSWALIRVVLAALVMAPAALLFRRRIPRGWGNLGGLAACSLFGVVINQVCFVEGLARTTVTHSAIINTTIPVWTLAFAVLGGREAVTSRKLLSLAVALAGVLLVLRPWTAIGSTSSPLAGDLLTLVNALSYSFFLVISKKVLERNNPVAATAALLVFGALGISVVGLPQLLQLDVAGLSSRTIWLGVFIVLFATVGAYLLNYFALSRSDSSLVALFIYLQPFIAALLGALVLGEQPGLWVLAGGALIFTGVFLAARGHRPAELVATPVAEP